jgi:hypothetical protein
MAFKLCFSPLGIVIVFCILVFISLFFGCVTLLGVVLKNEEKEGSVLKNKK